MIKLTMIVLRLSAFACALGVAMPCFAQNTPLARIVKHDLSPAMHMQKFSATQTPNVCFVGDSTFTDNEGGSAIAADDSLAAMLRRRMREDNPGKTIAFSNWSIGGESWNTLQRIPAFFPSWYTNHSIPWLTYVRNASCDTLFIGMGVNDGSLFTMPMMASVFHTISLWAQVPDIILVSNERAANVPPTNTPQHQIGDFTTAAFERTTATSDGAAFRSPQAVQLPNLPHIGLIDVGRYSAMAVDGIDPGEQYMTRTITNPISTMPIPINFVPGG